MEVMACFSAESFLKKFLLYQIKLSQFFLRIIA